MAIHLKEARVTDASLIHTMQVKAFRPLLEKYQDIETNPGAESEEDVRKRLTHSKTVFYLVYEENHPIGAACVVRWSETVNRISPLFILPQFQGKGYAKEVMKKVEVMHPKARVWQLATIKEEAKLCSFYEKVGFCQTGQREVKSGMTLIFYEKSKETEHA
jgi:predicted acetyltransferase